MTDPTYSAKVFSRKVKFKLGAMGTEQIQEAESFFVAEFLNKEEAQLQLLDDKDNLTTVKFNVTMEELKDDYVFIPDYFRKKQAPEKVKESKYLTKGDKHMERKEFFSAEYEFDNAIKANPQSVKGRYGKGKALLARGEEDEAFQVFEDLANIKELYGKEYKHTFNSLGIDLRKLDKYDEAIRNYKRALYMDGEDEILHYNIAHAYFKIDMPKEAKEHLEQAMKINPRFKEGKEFLEMIMKDLAD